MLSGAGCGSEARHADSGVSAPGTAAHATSCHHAHMPTHGGLEDAQRQRLCETKVTLDGEPARIIGWSHPFATVSRSDGRGGRVEYAWLTVARVVEAGGAFQS